MDRRRAERIGVVSDSTYGTMDIYLVTEERLTP